MRRIARESIFVGLALSNATLCPVLATQVPKGVTCWQWLAAQDVSSHNHPDTASIARVTQYLADNSNAYRVKYLFNIFVYTFGGTLTLLHALSYGIRRSLSQRWLLVSGRLNGTPSRFMQIKVWERKLTLS